MATLVLGAVGTIIAGPAGGAIGSLIGSQIDNTLFAPNDRDGPRLRELSISTSSYGTPIPRHFGTVRSAGSIIWATDLVESSETVGGGKGQPSTRIFSYSSSFAVALSSRPVERVGRIWADGNLLRGAAGDLKTGGTMRFYKGYGDQRPDPLIAAAEGMNCPAFRGLAYVVFEDLQLADFGNRLPSLTFEIIADDGEVLLVDIVDGVDRTVAVNRPLPGLVGFSDEGGSVVNTLATIDTIYPLASDAGTSEIKVFSPDAVAEPIALLPPPAIDPSDESFGGSHGVGESRAVSRERIPSGLRYYDTGRDYQAGMQLAGGQALSGPALVLEFPGAMAAGNARALAQGAARRARALRERLSYRIAEMNLAITAGSIFAVPGKSGAWRIENWEWREFGIELELSRVPATGAPRIDTDSGRALPPADAISTPTLLTAYELPWDGTSSPDIRRIYAAPSSASSGWTGAAMYAEHANGLTALGTSGNRRSITGATTTSLLPSTSLIADRETVLTVKLNSADFSLGSETIEGLSQGANRALVGQEMIQFNAAEALGNGEWALRGLLRGRGGTEHLARSPRAAGASFVLLDHNPVRVDENIVGPADRLVAIGLADTNAVVAPILSSGATRRPLAPVHPRLLSAPDGQVTMCWTRRARGAWAWDGTVEPPLVEQSELYEIGLGEPDSPVMVWLSTETQHIFSTGEIHQLRANYGALNIWVRQVGTYARSLPLLLTTL